MGLRPAAAETVSHRETSHVVSSYYLCEHQLSSHVYKTHLSKDLADFRTGYEVTLSTEDSMLGVGIVTMSGMTQAK